VKVINYNGETRSADLNCCKLLLRSHFRVIILQQILKIFLDMKNTRHYFIYQFH